MREIVNTLLYRSGRDANEKVSGHKRGLAVDVLGLLIAVVVLAASVHDNAAGIALPDGLGRVTEDIRIMCKTLLELPDPRPPAPPTTKLPDHPAHHQIVAVSAAADAPLRARAVCETMDVEIAPNNINDVRLKLKRLVERGILVEAEQGLFTQPRPWPTSDPAARPLAPSERATRAPTSHRALRVADQSMRSLRPRTFGLSLGKFLGMPGTSMVRPYTPARNSTAPTGNSIQSALSVRTTTGHASGSAGLVLQ